MSGSPVGSTVATCQPGVQLEGLLSLTTNVIWGLLCPRHCVGAWNTSVSSYQFLPSWDLESRKENLPWMGTDKTKVELRFLRNWNSGCVPW